MLKPLGSFHQIHAVDVMPFWERHKLYGLRKSLRPGLAEPLSGVVSVTEDDNTFEVFE